MTGTKVSALTPRCACSAKGRGTKRLWRCSPWTEKECGRAEWKPATYLQLLHGELTSLLPSAADDHSQGITRLCSLVFQKLLCNSLFQVLIELVPRPDALVGYLGVCGERKVEQESPGAHALASTPAISGGCCSPEILVLAIEHLSSLPWLMLGDQHMLRYLFFIPISCLS